ncbi:conserved Plasmodium protein, unknown function [Plasmodium malariae]|uniref:Uncharacterized protein n=1 Tax=Plasmodium malariae TaxID=5858 RepID=A0A1C3KCY2_PLAMA|nr:conserved Plasmodium protein, unknown function [Plasmodium malariae]
MKEGIPDLILKFEKKEKERLKRKRKRKTNRNNVQNRGSQSFIYFLFLHNKNKVVEITTNNFDLLKGEIIEVKKYTSNNKLKGIILTNAIKNNLTNCTFEKLYISLSNIYTCMPITSNSNEPLKEKKNIATVIINSYKILMVNKIYEKFKKIGGQLIKSQQNGKENSI